LCPSVIVLDNASYHNIKTAETVVPNFNQRKAVLQDYLSKHNIPFQSLETKKQLYEKIKFKKLLSTYQSNPPHDYQRAKLSTFYLFLKGSLGHQNHQLVTTCSLACTTGKLPQ
jgi:hypothetical protein